MIYCLVSLILAIFAILTGCEASGIAIQFFSNENFNLLMGNETKLDYSIIINPNNITALTNAQSLLIQFRPITLTPQFDIVEFADTNTTQTKDVIISLDDLKTRNYIYNSSILLRATYIGHATIESKAYLLNQMSNESLSVSVIPSPIELTINKLSGPLEKVFLFSVIIFITISYINLGAQIDTENVRRLIEKPKIIFFGLLIGVTVMPATSWIAGQIFFPDQPMYRIGSFIYACGPAASASVLWSVMFDADKELALGLQISSTICALLTMPSFLYAMDVSIGHYTVKTPYINLARTLFVLMVALFVGSRLVNFSQKAKGISQRIFRPLTMSVLMFIVIFSSIVYYFIYRMFDWNITFMALIVTCATYIISGLLGYLIHGNLNHMITISISSTYRNSGVAFAALVVAFQPCDVFIAYVPCLTQVVITSLIGLILYTIKSINKRI